MKILLTGANGYIGTRLLPVLIENGHDVVCLVRDKRRFIDESDFSGHITIIQGDLLKEESLLEIPHDIDVAYYLVHSMANAYRGFEKLEGLSAENFLSALKKTACKQIIYLTGIVNDDDLSTHLSSRLNVEKVLKNSHIPLTVLRAAIIIGSGSASFEIIRDLTEKLPVMVAPKWLKTKCQPIAIRDVLAYLVGVLNQEKAFNETFDIGGPDVLTYKDVLLKYAKVRKLNRRILIIPVLTPKLSSHWLNLVTSVDYSLARSLVDSMRVEVICQNDHIKNIVPRDCFTYEEALMLAFEKIEQNSIASSWKDALNKGYLTSNFMDQIKVPQNGTLSYKVKKPFKRDIDEVFENIWSIGGKRGWYYWDWIWNLRGLMDKMVGGVGTRRGRTSNVDLQPGDALDFWRVLLADKKNKRLLLFAEMKVPGEAWLEFKIIDRGNQKILSQVASFRPHGFLGRLFWWAMWPFHLFIFNGMATEITRYQPKEIAL